jgi:HAD superfamily hydrolase (TIGR01493 family)
MKLKVIAFDVFNTVVQFAHVPLEEKKAYADHIRENDGVTYPWKPLRLPESWEHLPAYPDSAEGLACLRERYTVVTLSNGPVGLLAKLSKRNGLAWDLITPLEARQVYKPNTEAYLYLCDVLDVRPDEVMMVTANEKFGDIGSAAKIGMAVRLLRHKWNGKPTIADLCQELLSPENVDGDQNKRSA